MLFFRRTYREQKGVYISQERAVKWLSCSLEVTPVMTSYIISIEFYIENSVLQKSRITLILINIEAI